MIPKVVATTPTATTAERTVHLMLERADFLREPLSRNCNVAQNSVDESVLNACRVHRIRDGFH